MPNSQVSLLFRMESFPKHELEVHKGEKHKIALLCEIFDFKAQKKSILEINLATCELYKCSKCEFKSRRVSQVKKHTNKLHGSGDQFLHHLKTDRNNTRRTWPRRFSYPANSELMAV